MDQARVRSLFDAIASRYDLLNHLLSGGMDIYWRAKALTSLPPPFPAQVLDVAAGTADFSIAALRRGAERVTGVDISEEMLKRGQAKIERLGLDPRITLAKGAAESLPFADGAFDAAIVAFGARNFENLRQGLTEMRRVLRPKGRIVVLEFSRPRIAVVSQLYYFYFRKILPRIGRIISRHDSAYSYLPDTVLDFPDGVEFVNILQQCGFSEPQQQRLTFGIVTVYTGYRP